MIKKVTLLLVTVLLVFGCKDYSKVYDIRGTWISSKIEDGIKIYQTITIGDSEDQPEVELNDKGKELKPTSIYYDYDWKVYYNNVLQDGNTKEGISETILNKCHSGNCQVVFKEFVSVFQPAAEGVDILSRYFILKLDGSFLTIAEYDDTNGSGTATVFIKQE